MDKTGNIVVIGLALVAVILLAAIAYNILSDKTEPTEAETTTQSWVDTTANYSGGDDEDSYTTHSTQKAKSFAVYDRNGKPVSLSQMRGKPTVVNFWATWCGYCTMEMPEFDKLYKEYGNDVNFMMVDLTDAQETEKAAARFVDKNGYSFPVYFDKNQSAAKAYNITSIPMTLFIDANGNLVEENLGAMDEGTIRSYIEQMM